MTAALLHDAMQACRAAVHEALGEALRAPRGDASYDEWVDRLVAAAALAANTWAVSNDYPQIAVEDVARIDRLAMGHVDYHAKVAIRVAHLVVYGKP